MTATPEAGRTILYIPMIRKGRGTGHLVRCARWVSASGNSFLYLPDDPENLGGIHEIPGVAALAAAGRVVHSLSDSDRFDIVVFDTRETDRGLYERMARHGSLCVGIDEGGALRGSIPYLIDILPGPRRMRPANVSSIGFLDLPEAGGAAGRDAAAGDTPNHEKGCPAGSVLLSFGGEDPAGLGTVLARFLTARGYFSPEEITVAAGPAAKEPDLPPGVTVRRFGASLREQLREYRIVFTSFGITPFEALRSGCRVILFNPTPYHRELSRNAGFPEIGVGRVQRRLLDRALKGEWNPEDDPRLHQYLYEPARSLDGVFRSLRIPEKPEALTDSAHPVPPKHSGHPECPACGIPAEHAIAREEGRTFFRCGGCGLIFQLLFENRPPSYTKEYFFEEYRAQYGRTYLEDFAAIRGYARSRLDHIAAAGMTGGSILDIGCAYGPFMAEAAGRGYAPYGIDISADAVDYVEKTLGFPAEAGDFTSMFESGQQPPFDGRQFDIVTMWYVIEHFEKPDILLDMLGKVLRPGGVFAFSTPTSEGISGRRNTVRFCLNSPRDHHTIWDRRTAKRVLNGHGFDVLCTASTGHHPERFPLVGQACAKSRLAAGIVGVASRVLGLGDTFEVYARFRGSVSVSATRKKAGLNWAAKRGSSGGETDE